MVEESRRTEPSFRDFWRHGGVQTTAEAGGVASCQSCQNRAQEVEGVW